MDENEEIIEESPVDEEIPVDVEESEPETPVETSPEEPAPVPVEASTPEPVKTPTEFKGFALSDGGYSLFEPSLEDEDSPEAQDLISKIGDGAYANLVRKYDRAKVEYDRNIEVQVTQEVTQGKQSLAGQVKDVSASVKSSYFDQPITDEDYAPIHADASAEVEEFRNEKIAEYQSKGFSHSKATLLADRELTSHADLYEKAVDIAIQKGIKAGKYRLVRTDGKPIEGQALIPAETPPVAKTPVPARQNQTRPTPPPIATTGRNGGGGPPVAAKVVPTPAEAAHAKSLGVDPVKFASFRRTH